MSLLDGRHILVAEDEPLVGLDIADALRSAGAHVISSHNVIDALGKAEDVELAAAILDVNLVGEDCSLVCQRLTERGVPFVFYTGFTDVPVHDKWPAAAVLKKPSSPEKIVEAIAKLVGQGLT